jgi:hypothetical protein
MSFRQVCLNSARHNWWVRAALIKTTYSEELDWSGRSTIMGVAHYHDLGLKQAEGSLQGIDNTGLLQAPVSVQDEALCLRLIDNPAARPLVVFRRRDAVGKTDSAQTLGIQCLPALPSLIVTGGMSKAVAIGFTFIKCRAINDKDTSHAARKFQETVVWDRLPVSARPG